MGWLLRAMRRSASARSGRTARANDASGSDKKIGFVHEYLNRCMSTFMYAWDANPNPKRERGVRLAIAIRLKRTRVAQDWPNDRADRSATTDEKRVTVPVLAAQAINPSRNFSRQSIG